MTFLIDKLKIKVLGMWVPAGLKSFGLRLNLSKGNLQKNKKRGLETRVVLELPFVFYGDGNFFSFWLAFEFKVELYFHNAPPFVFVFTLGGR